MAETQLISISDVQSYRHISPTFDTNRFNAFVNDIQKDNLRYLLGDALYYDFMNDARTSGKYYNLLNGIDYSYGSQTIKYYGLKPVLCYWWLAMAYREGDIFLQNIGPIDFVNNSQNSFEHAKQKEIIANQFMSKAQNYANDVIKYLNENSSIFPLWSGDEEQSSTEFITFKI